MSRKKKNRDKGKKQPKPKGPPRATTADRHILYQESVQNVESEIDFVDDTYKELRGRHAETIREDFCGTANTSCEWIKRRPTNKAIGVDIDQSVLDWGKAHNIDQLDGDAQTRMTILRDDVTTILTDPVDIILAMNFSYFCFKTRDALRGYFKNALRSLDDGGMLIMDCYGGAESLLEQEEEREIEESDYLYVWDQAKFDPISSHMTCHIHFHFDDGSKMRHAFTYDWRMWTLPEIRELLEEAGFKKSTVYWEGTDEDDEEEGNGEFEAVDEGEADPAWIAYIVAEK